MYDWFITHWPNLPEFIFNASFAVGLLLGSTVTAFIYEKMRPVHREKLKEHDMLVYIDRARIYLKEKISEIDGGRLDFRELFGKLNFYLRFTISGWKRRKILRLLAKAEHHYKKSDFQKSRHFLTNCLSVLENS